MVEILKPDFVYGDERGLLVQLVHEGFKQVNVITSKAGEVRGGHYHKLNREAFYVISGSFELICTREKEIERRSFHVGEFFLVEPCVAHEFRYLEDTVLIGLYDVGVEMPNGLKDIYVKELPEKDV